MIDDDKDIVSLLLAGDEPTFWAFYGANKKPLIQVCCRFLGEDPEVEDLVHETFRKILVNLHHFHHECSLSIWVNHIAINLCRDLLDKRKKTGSVFSDFLLLPSRGKKRIHSPEVLSVLQEEMSALNPKDQELLSLRKNLGLSDEAIAVHLKVPVATAISELSRVRQDLNERIQKRLPDWKEDAL